MKINWIQPGAEVKEGYEDGVMELEYFPGIPMSIIFGDPKPQNEKDAEEREWLIKESDKASIAILEDKFTRRALFYDDYPGILKLNCYGLFHFKVNDKSQLELYVYMRSTNIKNLGYDLITIDKVYERVYEALDIRSKELSTSFYVSKGQIKIHFASLHYYKNR